MEDVVSTIIWAALFQGLILAILYLSSQRHGSLANRLLGLFLLVIIYEGTLAFINLDEIMGYTYWYFSFPEVKLLYPILFFHYVLEKLGRTKGYRRFLRSNYWLELGIVCITLINLGCFLITGNKIEGIVGNRPVAALFMVQQYYAFALIIYALVVSIIEIKRYRTLVERSYSDVQMLKIDWLWRLVLAVVPITIVWGFDLAMIAFGKEYNSDIQLLTWGFVIVFIYFVSFQAFRNKNLMDGVSSQSDSLQKNQESSHGGRNDLPVGNEDSDQILIRKLKQHMKEEQPFLDASLSIYQLAKQLGVSSRELSLIINHRLNKHFFDFVNEYRIRKAMELLKDPENQKTTVLEILYAVGFNSKSSFNTVFKKVTGKTPTQFRKTANMRTHAQMS